VHLKHLSVVDFRSYATAELPLTPGVTTLIGLNGQGKTNLVEAAGYLATLGSHRVAGDTPLVRFGADQAVIRGAVVRHGRETLIEMEINAGRSGSGNGRNIRNGRNRARLNRSPVPRPREVLGTLRTVLFAPEDLAMVKGDPSERRRFLDELLVSRQPRWAGVRADYDKVLRQRNALLKSAAPVLRRDARRARRPLTGAPTRLSTDTVDKAVDEADGVDRVDRVDGVDGVDGVDSGHSALHTLDVWNSHLAQVGAQLLYARLRLLHDLRPYLASAYDEVSDASSDVSIAYRCSLRDEMSAAIAAGAVPEMEELHDELLASLAAVRVNEIERGVSLVGPHRDDVVLTLGKLPAKGYASHGESWSLALGLRLAAYQLLRHDLGDDPVLILDDVFAELDSGRRERLAALIADCEQVLITAAVASDVPAVLADSGTTYRVTMGQVTRAD
jgi:DNA replication and repair protein RecF